MYYIRASSQTPSSPWTATKKSIQISHIVHIALVLRLFCRFFEGDGCIERQALCMKPHMSAGIREIPIEIDKLHPLPD